jgi:hypothetical protein
MRRGMTVSIFLVIFLVASLSVQAGETNDSNSIHSFPQQSLVLQAGGSNVVYSTIRFSQTFWKKFSIEPTVHFLFDDNNIGELLYANLLYQIGLGKFSIHLTGGPGLANVSTIFNNHSHWTFNYGLGSSIPVANNLSVRIDLSVNEVYHREQVSNRGNSIIKTGKGFMKDLMLVVGMAYGM